MPVPGCVAALPSCASMAVARTGPGAWSWAGPSVGSAGVSSFLAWANVMLGDGRADSSLFQYSIRTIGLMTENLTSRSWLVTGRIPGLVGRSTPLWVNGPSPTVDARRARWHFARRAGNLKRRVVVGLNPARGVAVTLPRAQWNPSQRRTSPELRSMTRTCSRITGDWQWSTHSAGVSPATFTSAGISLSSHMIRIS